MAAKFASTTILEKLKEKGCKVNKRNADGLSPLHLAAKSRNLEAVKWFTDNGAKLDDLDDKKKTPENRAVRGKQKHLVQRRNDRTGLKAEVSGCFVHKSYAVDNVVWYKKKTKKKHIEHDGYSGTGYLVPDLSALILVFSFFCIYRIISRLKPTYI